MLCIDPPQNSVGLNRSVTDYLSVHQSCQRKLLIFGEHWRNSFLARPMVGQFGEMIFGSVRLFAPQRQQAGYRELLNEVFTHRKTRGSFGKNATPFRRQKIYSCGPPTIDTTQHKRRSAVTEYPRKLRCQQLQRRSTHSPTLLSITS